jgi:uncharacterized membrane protein (TIGR02234 family)
MADPRRSFGPTVLVGLAGAALAAVASSRTWVTATGDAAGVPVHVTAKGSDVAPLAGALSLVALAAWGVLLVTRGRVRQGVAALGALAAVGAVVAVIVGYGDRRSVVLALLQDKGATTVATLSVSGWLWCCAVGALVTAAALLVAVRRAAAWPAMGSRYDAPAARAATPTVDATSPDVTSTDLWKALDEGEDPTTGTAP